VTLRGYDAYPPSSEPESAGPALGTTNVQIGDKVAQMKATFTAAGTSSSKPVRLTEIGWPTVGFVDEGKRARWLMRSIVLAALNAVDLRYIYDMYDGRPSPTSSVNPEDHFGLVGHDGKPKMSSRRSVLCWPRTTSSVFSSKVPVRAMTEIC